MIFIEGRDLLHINKNKAWMASNPKIKCCMVSANSCTKRYADSSVCCKLNYSLCSPSDSQWWKDHIEWTTYSDDPIRQSVVKWLNWIRNRLNWCDPIWLYASLETPKKCNEWNYLSVQVPNSSCGAESAVSHLISSLCPIVSCRGWWCGQDMQARYFVSGVCFFFVDGRVWARAVLQFATCKGNVPFGWISVCL